MPRKRKKRQQRYRIAEVVNPSGEPAWRVSGTSPAGERVRRQFADYQQALGEQMRLELLARDASSRPVQLHHSHLSVDELRDAESAREALGSEGSLSEAARWYVKHFRPAGSRVSVRDAVAEFVRSRERRGLRPKSVGDYRVRLQALVDRYGDLPLNELTPEHFERVIHRKREDGRARAVVVRNIDRSKCGTFCAWAMRRGYLGENPVARLDALRVEHQEPRVYGVPECRALLATARVWGGGKLLPYVVLGLLCGIRPKEALGLRWPDVQLASPGEGAAGFVTVSGAVAKTRSRRHVALTDSAAAWLWECQRLQVPFDFSWSWKRQFMAEVRKAATGFAWLPDGLRHTAITMHLTQFGDENRTAAWAGNSPGVIHRHYKGLALPSQAAEFWGILPTEEERKIVPMSG